MIHVVLLLTKRNCIFLTLLITSVSVHISQSFVQLYNTEDSSSVELYDCINFKNDSNVIYCRRPGKVIDLNRHRQTCSSYGTKIDYTTLQRLNISVDEVLRWSSSVEKADEYAAYLSNTSVFDDTENLSLCNCTNLSVFGKFCEYQLFFDSQSFHDIIETLFEMRYKDIYSNQIYGNILCYMTLTCDYGLLCLDWRDICNGAQNCMNGLDEENCDLLEFNECEEDEFRCMNGQCIPDEYWMDGWLESSRECMDHSDEGVIDMAVCFFELRNFDCDERLCPPTYWSCGDGQCINSLQRFSYQTFLDDFYYCLTFRDCNYACEACNHPHLWTVENGSCWNFDELKKSELELAAIITDDFCLLQLKCRLAEINEREKCHCPLDKLCQFNHDDNEVNQRCSHPIQYPPYGLYRPYLSTYYTKGSFLFEEKTPSMYTVKGSIKCRGYQGMTLDKEINLELGTGNNFEEDTNFLIHIGDYPTGFEYLFCMNHHIYKNKSDDAPKFDELCWSDTTKTFSINQSYNFHNVCSTEPTCVSSYRINDGYVNCYNYQDEERYDYRESCTNIRKYRLQCSLNEQPTCLPTELIGTSAPDCYNHYDEFIFGSDIPLEGGSCLKQNDHRCQLFRNYIEMTTKNNTKETIHLFVQSLRDNSYSREIPYHRYCDSFWDLPTRLDESPKYCQQWICAKDQYQCPKTGQCIDPKWICDGVWDCSDGSDEEGIFIINQLSPHNQAVVNLNRVKRACINLYKARPLSMLCNYTQEYPCLRNISNFNDLWNFTLHKPCIPLSQLGDGIIHCYGGRDEKTTIERSVVGGMLGDAFLCQKTYETVLYRHICRRIFTCSDFEDAYGCLSSREQVVASIDSTPCGYDPSDVFCLNGSCAKTARCNGEFNCEYGEDEYMCGPKDDYTQKYGVDQLHYRHSRQRNTQYSYQTRKIASFPLSLKYLVTNTNVKQNTQEKFFSPESKVESFKKMQIVYNCNRGVTIQAIESNRLSCFCPPSYYGEQCEYYSDRLTVVTHLNYTNSPYLNIDDESVVLQILVLFLFEDEVIDHYNFRVRPADEINTYIKHKFFLLYSRSEKYLNHKQTRYFNRTDIINNHPYSIRFEAYKLIINQTMKLIGAWQFHNYFDYLPSVRLAKVLRFPTNYTINDPCHSNPCNQRSMCQRILNKNSTTSYVCLCQSPFYGKKCALIDDKCSNFCAPHSVCKPKYNGILTSNQQPFCLCPLNYYGSRCFLKYTACQLQPCANNGKCIQVFDPAEVRSRYCKCTEKFYGEDCEHERISVRIQMKLSNLTIFSPTGVLASVVQYFDFGLVRSDDIYLKHQQLSLDLQLKWEYNHDQIVAPTFAFSKIYDSNYRLTGPLFYLLYIQQNTRVINITIEMNEVNYCAHVLTLMNKNDIDDSVPLFFKYHALCYEKLVRTGTKCFRDDDYLCICGENHYRAECFGYDHSINRCDYCLSDGYCILGDPNNRVDFKCLCPRCHHGKFCQFSNELLSFTLDSLIVKDILYNGKLASISYITITTLVFLVGFFNNLCSFLTFIRPIPRKFGVVVTGTHIHEAFYYITILDPSYTATNVTMCVTNYPGSTIATYNRVNVLIHYFVPFLIQFFSITILITQTARSRARVVGQNNRNTFMITLKQKFQMHKDHYLTPTIIVLSALPQAIFSFSYACTELTEGWQRYTLLTTYFLSYLPQILGFILYVLPSKTYKEEFRKTFIGKLLIKI
ncbi:unnamed protein product [Adineta steineri]|uniref:EGF-like domain-containing protein n=1 Tax=Adineta steineri TaxID=433720 RepID=A0A816DE59_9BILA|nr:unnamed protein product [Adineta steineri]CAF1636151.1 unnamed protein product [Adineta steineri]